MMLFTIALAAEPEGVSVFVDAPLNLADEAHPIPALFVENQGKQPIELELFQGVPLLWLEKADAPREEPGARCGSGYVPMTIAPGQTASFPLWGTPAHGPGASGHYRVVLPYAQGGVQLEALTETFSLGYGDVAPRDQSSGGAGKIALLRAAGERVREGIDPLPAIEVGRQLMPAVEQCIAAARARLPWLRGSFSLVVYRYPSQPAPVLYLGDSLLGDAEVNTCLGAIEPPPVDGKYDLGFAVSLSP